MLQRLDDMLVVPPECQVNKEQQEAAKDSLTTPTSMINNNKMGDNSKMES